MLSKIRKFVEEYNMISRSEKVLAAVSGGADSMCLLSVLTELTEYGISVEAVHFNHCLRGAESDRDAEFTEKFCKEKGILCYVGKGDAASFAVENRLGIEEAARKLRYAFFEETAMKTGAGKIATAHTADDNAETVIMNLTRGAGLSGLCGIPPVRGNIIRPLLPVSRKEIEAYLKKRGIDHVEDSSNKSDDYTRNRIRHLVIPVLRDINPNLCGSIFTSTELVRRDNDFIAGQADKFVSEKLKNGKIPKDDLAGLERPVFSRVVRSIAGSGTGEKHVDAVYKLCKSENPSKSVDIPGMKVYREYGNVAFGKEPDIKTFEPVTIEIGQKIAIKELKLTVSCQKSILSAKINKTFTTFLFKSEGICGKINIRPRMTGDKIELLGRNGAKTIKKLFIEKHIPARKRELIPVIADDNAVMAVYGIGQAAHTKPEPGDEVLIIRFERDMCDGDG